MTKKKKEIHKGVFLQLIGGNVLFDIADDALILGMNEGRERHAVILSRLTSSPLVWTDK